MEVVIFSLRSSTCDMIFGSFRPWEVRSSQHFSIESFASIGSIGKSEKAYRYQNSESCSFSSINSSKI